MTQTAFSIFKALFAYPRYLFTDIAEFVATIRRYYPNRQFRRADLRCLWSYMLRNPDAMCLRYLRKFPNDSVQKIYGESFFTTLEDIANEVELTQHDVIYDLGCGRGRSVFWFNAIYQCRAVGVEINPAFVRLAQKIKKKLGMHNVEFLLANLMDVDYSDATVIYFYGTAFSDEAIVKLVDHFTNLRPGTRIISVSYPLTRYTKAPLFELEQSFKGKYLWGHATIYIQRKL